MKLKYRLIIKQIGDQYSASTSNFEEFNGVIFFSEVGKYILEELEFGITKEELMEKLISRYIGDKAEIEAEVDNFISTLTQNGLLEF